MPSTSAPGCACSPTSTIRRRPAQYRASLTMGGRAKMAPRPGTTRAAGVFRKNGIMIGQPAG